jgi:chromosome partitioning protein
LEDSLIIAITNQKGGVGKTTTAINVSGALALMGYRMLLIDTDPQAHSSTSCLSDPGAYSKSLYDILIHPQDNIESVIAKSTIPGLDVVVSRISMAKLEPALLGEIDGHYRLKDIIQPIVPKYDHLVIVFGAGDLLSLLKSLKERHTGNGAGPSSR